MRRERAGEIARFLAQPTLARLFAALDGDGEETRVVGGAVRNLLLGEPASDIDLATTALPEETVRRGRAAGFKAVPTGIEHGTVTLVAEGASFEVTTLRSDVETDGRRAKVVFGRDFAADALRRDFTINALGLGRDGRIHDYCAGLGDLERRRVRFIGDAATRIREDYLRILRFFRFHARYGAGEPDPEGLRACIAGRGGLSGLSRERVRAELMKLLVAPGVAGTLRAMAGAGLVVPVIGGVPHLSRFAGVAAADGGDPMVRLAALAVSVGEDAPRLRERLRLSNAEFDRIGRIARALEGLGGRETVSVPAARRVAGDAGAQAAIAALILLHASAGEAQARRMREIVAEIGNTPPFLLKGTDVVALGVLAGPKVGAALALARSLWIDAGCAPAKDRQAALLRDALSRLP